MTIRSWSAVLLCGVSVAFAGVERQHHRHPAAAAPVGTLTVAARSPDASSDRTFADASGLRIRVPAAWQAVPAKTAVLALAAPLGAGYASLSLDVPAMSWHPPFIPIGVVTTRYLDALRQSDMPDAQVQETADLTLPGASARRVRARGHCRGKVRVDVAVVFVHAGQIFILSADSDDAGAPAARAALDAVVASIQWAK